VSPEETQDTCHRAATLFRQLAARDDLRALLDSGVCLFEVPFSLCLPADTANDRGLIVRGTIDCLVQHPDRAITIVEFKTGVPHPSHERQLALYVQAARALFPDTPVSGRLFHPPEQT
jgi:ATP-dependent exoDNAse (exonuclease V) beta subunit